MTADLQRVIKEIEYVLSLIDGAPRPANNLELDPQSSLIQYARRLVKVAKEESNVLPIDGS